MSESMKGRPCPYKVTICQEGYCQNCQIYLDKLPGRKATPDWLAEYEKEQNDKLEILRK